MSRYDDIIDLPHYEPRHKRMSLENRAAQFAPFAALTGHGAAIAETARLTEGITELSGDEQSRMSRILLLALERRLSVTITYFIPDLLKDGGRHEKIRTTIKKLDESERTLTLSNGRILSLDLITAIDGDVIDAVL